MVDLRIDLRRTWEGLPLPHFRSGVCAELCPIGMLILGLQSKSGDSSLKTRDLRNRLRMLYGIELVEKLA